MTTRSSRSKMMVCQRCRRGVMLADTYRALLERKKAKVVEPVLCPTCFLVDGPLSKEYGQVKWFSPDCYWPNGGPYARERINGRNCRD